MAVGETVSVLYRQFKMPLQVSMVGDRKNRLTTILCAIFHGKYIKGKVMRTIKTLISENIDRCEMTVEEHRAFVEYWFDKYETTGFCERFESPFDLLDDQAPYKGMKFHVLGRCQEKEFVFDLECLPMWHIMFDDGFEMDAYPEEICKIERVGNQC